MRYLDLEIDDANKSSPELTKNSYGIQGSFHAMEWWHELYNSMIQLNFMKKTLLSHIFSGIIGNMNK